MRAFDLLAKAEQEIRTASHPRYHFEMVLLRWMHLRKLVPLTELLEQMGGGRIKSAPTTTSAPAGADRTDATPRSHRPAARSHRPVAASHRPATSSHRSRSNVAPTSSRSHRPKSADVATSRAPEGRVARRDPLRQGDSSTTPSSRRRSGSTSTDDRVTLRSSPDAQRAARAVRSAARVARSRRRASGRTQDRRDRPVGVQAVAS